ncbi:MAG: magnesium transporter [Burkholderiales bacterium]|jgi:magnesium transporter|nr:magnesium transporter [Burkholderiales bacterium]
MTEALQHELATPARDPEEAQRALARVQALLEKQRRVEALVEHEAAPSEQKHQLVEQLVHKQHLAELNGIVDRLHPADIAYILEALPLDDRLVVLDSVKADRDGEILLEVSDAVRETLIASMDREELVDAVETLEADEIADLADDLPADVVEEVKQGLTAEERAQLRAAMSYPEESVGARMDFEMVTIRDDVTLEVVLRYLRRFDELPDHTDQVFVVDRDDVLKGALPLDRLLINEPDTEVAAVMKSDILTLAPLDDAGEAAQAFERYNLVSAPVVDANGRLIGRLTVDEVVDVIREEGEAEALANAGLREEEDLFASVWNSAKNRWLWLGVNLCTAFFASRVISAFEGTIERVVALAALMPIVAGIAGNSGNQTLTLLVRSLALGQVTGVNQRRLVTKEIVIALFNGAVWGGLAGIVVFLLYSDSGNALLLGALMFLAMILNMLVGAAVGLAVPLALRAAGRDPAIGGSVLLTFTTDSGGFFIFLGLATLFFR